MAGNPPNRTLTLWRPRLRSNPQTVRAAPRPERANARDGGPAPATSTRSSPAAPPLGPITLAAEDGALAALYMTEHRHARTDLGDEVDDCLPAAREQLAAYFAGELTTFDLPLALQQLGVEVEAGSEVTVETVGRDDERIGKGGVPADRRGRRRQVRRLLRAVGSRRGRPALGGVGLRGGRGPGRGHREVLGGRTLGRN